MAYYKAKCRVCRYEWLAQANTLIRHGCQKCHIQTLGRYSKIALEWLAYESKRRRLHIQHAENGGEHIITDLPGKFMKVDGYNARKKIVFEFYGDASHGNPNRFKPRSRPSAFNNRTARELYKATMKREQQLVKLGYTIVSMWGQDWRSRGK
jgi:hypothetical protein